MKHWGRNRGEISWKKKTKFRTDSLITLVEQKSPGSKISKNQVFFSCSCAGTCPQHQTQHWNLRNCFWLFWKLHGNFVLFYPPRLLRQSHSWQNLTDPSNKAKRIPANQKRSWLWKNLKHLNQILQSVIWLQKRDRTTSLALDFGTWHVIITMIFCIYTGLGTLIYSTVLYVNCTNIVSNPHCPTVFDVTCVTLLNMSHCYSRLYTTGRTDPVQCHVWWDCHWCMPSTLYVFESAPLGSTVSQGSVGSCKKAEPSTPRAESSELGPSGRLHWEPISIICSMTRFLCSCNVNVFYPSGVETENWSPFVIYLPVYEKTRTGSELNESNSLILSLSVS